MPSMSNSSDTAKTVVVAATTAFDDDDHRKEVRNTSIAIIDNGSLIKEEIQSLREENATLLEDVKTLKEDVHDVKALLLLHRNNNNNNDKPEDTSSSSILKSSIDPPTAKDNNGENDADESLSLSSSSSHHQGTRTSVRRTTAAAMEHDNNNNDHDNTIVLYSVDDPLWDWRPLSSWSSSLATLPPRKNNVVSDGVSVSAAAVSTTVDAANSGCCSDLAIVGDDEDDDDDDDDEHSEILAGEDSLLQPNGRTDEDDEDDDLECNHEEVNHHRVHGNSFIEMSVTTSDDDETATAVTSDDDDVETKKVTVPSSGGGGGSGGWWQFCERIVFDFDASRYEEEGDERSEDEEDVDEGAISQADDDDDDASPEDEEGVDEGHVISLADNKERKEPPKIISGVDYSNEAARDRKEEEEEEETGGAAGRETCDCSNDDENEISTSSSSETAEGTGAIISPTPVASRGECNGGSSSQWCHFFFSRKKSKDKDDAATAAANKRRRKNARKRQRRRIRRKMANKKKEGGGHNNITNENGMMMLVPPSETTILLGRIWKRSVFKIALIGILSIAPLVSITLGHEEGGTMEEVLPRILLPTSSSSSDHSSSSSPNLISAAQEDGQHHWGQVSMDDPPSSQAMIIETSSISSGPRSLRKVHQSNIGNYDQWYNAKKDDMTSGDVVPPTKPDGFSIDVAPVLPPTTSNDINVGVAPVPPTTPNGIDVGVAPTPSADYVCDSDPKQCGCPKFNQVDYQGDVSVTQRNHDCQDWNSQSPHKHSHAPRDYQSSPYGVAVDKSELYLAENYCRNPDNDPNGPWCYTTNPNVRFDYCKIPDCPPLTIPPPLRSVLPTSSPTLRPSVSSSPTRTCPVADINSCACASNALSDYRGTLSKSSDGMLCERWDAPWIIDELGFVPELEFPDAGLLVHSDAGVGGHNFCRNPSKDKRGAYCLTKGSFVDFVAGDGGGLTLEGGGDEVDDSDSNSTDKVAAAEAAMEMVSYEYCDVPTCDPCSCMPPCGTPNLESCGCPSFFQSEACCYDDTGDEVVGCKCGYLKEACLKSLENGHTDFCEDAELACCDEASNSFGSCKCDLYERMCDEFPFRSMCDHAASSCCENRNTYDDDVDMLWGDAQCLCDFYTHISTFLQVGDKSLNGNCATAAGHRVKSRAWERPSLQKLYMQTGGENWRIKTGWLDERVSHCQWHGVTCNAQNIVTGINLRNNNLVGGPPSAVDSFPELIVLDLAGNKLTGSLNGTEFYKLRSLTHVDISMNMFTGHADMQFSSAIIYANYSYNRFSSAGFKRFNPAYEAMWSVDLRHNELDMEAEDFFRNVPVDVTELVLSKNALRGTFPDPFPSLGKLTRFAFDDNDMEGSIPLDFANFMDLAVLNLAGNQFSGSIPPDIGNLGKLVVLNVTSNRLGWSIPASLGKLEGVMEILDVSNNMLGGRIPGEIGKLREAIVLLDENSLTPPAPVGVCKIATVQDDKELCPPEIKILEDFYLSFNGPEWVNNSLWLDDSVTYCSWFGVTCDEYDRSTVKLEQGHNGLTGGLSARSIDMLSGLIQLDTLNLTSNYITGTIPTDIGTLSRLSELDLSRQNPGLEGSIPEEIADLSLTVLNLAHNRLDHIIPSVFGTLDEIKVLDLSYNSFSQSIPSELGRLKESITSLDLSSNNLEGWVPSELGKLEDIMLNMGGNDALSGPAPLSICLKPGTDLTSDTKLCPPERNILREIYISAKGGEWTKSSLWLDEYANHCLWFGVECDEKDEFVVKLKLNSNGLSGTLSPNISSLSFLEHVDLSDNDIKGTIPTEIGRLSNLNFLRLCYNRFVGDGTNFGHDLKNLELLHLHSNLLSGSIPSIDWPHEVPWSYISDCGNPTEFEQSLGCDECTMCCNAQGDCYPQEDTSIQASGWRHYVDFTWTVFALILGTACFIALISLGVDKYRNQNQNFLVAQHCKHEKVDNDAKYALTMIGDDSVYQFFLGKSWVGWIICLATILSQFWILFLFVEAAEIDLSNDNTDLVYTWKCPRDQDECRDTADLGWQGWLAFSILMAAHLLKDIINGTKMVILSGKERHAYRPRIRFFAGGTLLGAVSLFTFYVSVIYNVAIATSNTEVIVNSVVILFICDIDELLYAILVSVNSDWVEIMCYQGHAYEKTDCSDAEQHDYVGDRHLEVAEQRPEYERTDISDTEEHSFVGNRNLDGVVQMLEMQVQALRKTMDMLVEQNIELKRSTENLNVQTQSADTETTFPQYWYSDSSFGDSSRSSSLFC